MVPLCVVPLAAQGASRADRADCGMSGRSSVQTVDVLIRMAFDPTTNSPIRCRATLAEMVKDSPTADDAAPLVRDVLPRLARGISQELLELGETALAAQVHDLRVRQPCPCPDKFCQSFYTENHTAGTPYGGDHRTVPLLPEGVMVNLDVVGGQIVHVEIIV
jgi:hypothetical protein